MIALAWLVCIAMSAAAIALLRRAARGAYAPGAGPWRRAAARLAHDRLAEAALFVLVLLAATAILAPALTPYDPTAQPDILKETNLLPSLRHPFGTDFASRDVLTRMLYGARITLSVSVLAVLLSTVLGTAYGAIAGYYGGRLDAFMMRAIDAALSVPRILLLIAVLAIAQHVSLISLVVLIAITGWFQTSRLVRAQVLVLREQEFTIAARALGARDREILWRHLLPNVASTVIVSATLAIGSVVYLEAALSYLGIGVQPPTPSWGRIIQDASADMAARWWLMFLPGLAIVITTIAINLFGDGLRDAFDPRSGETA
jgi:peptide/nickel transport system permease protein